MSCESTIISASTIGTMCYLYTLIYYIYLVLIKLRVVFFNFLDFKKKKVNKTTGGTGGTETSFLRRWIEEFRETREQGRFTFKFRRKGISGKKPMMLSGVREWGRGGAGLGAGGQSVGKWRHM